MKSLRVFLTGMYERARWGDGFGRSYHDSRFRELYDHGANVTDAFRFLLFN